MRLIAAILLAALCTRNLNAEELTFYQKETDAFWSVTGGAETNTGQATCYGAAGTKNGSFIQIHRSLVDDELWALVHDTEWEIQGPDRGSLRWNFFGPGKSGLIGGANFPAGRSKSPGYGHLKLPHLMITGSAI